MTLLTGLRFRSGWSLMKDKDLNYQISPNNCVFQRSNVPFQLKPSFYFTIWAHLDQNFIHCLDLSPSYCILFRQGYSQMRLLVWSLTNKTDHHLRCYPTFHFGSSFLSHHWLHLFHSSSWNSMKYHRFNGCLGFLHWFHSFVINAGFRPFILILTLFRFILMSRLIL